MRRVLAFGFLAGLAACKQADSVVLVNVAVDGNVAPLDSLRVAISTA
jgi:hypothetical protein